MGQLTKNLRKKLGFSLVFDRGIKRGNVMYGGWCQEHLYFCVSLYLYSHTYSLKGYLWPLKRRRKT